MPCVRSYTAAHSAKLSPPRLALVLQHWQQALYILLSCVTRFMLVLVRALLCRLTIDDCSRSLPHLSRLCSTLYITSQLPITNYNDQLTFDYFQVSSFELVVHFVHRSIKYQINSSSVVLYVCIDILDPGFYKTSICSTRPSPSCCISAMISTTFGTAFGFSFVAGPAVLAPAVVGIRCSDCATLSGDSWNAAGRQVTPMERPETAS